jgi:hypothetical protein
LFFSANFGRIELGREDGAEDDMLVDANDTQAGTGGLDGDGRTSASSTSATPPTPRR